MIYVLHVVKSQEKEDLPLDSGPQSFHQFVPPSRLNLPDAITLAPRTASDLEALEDALASLPGQPIEVRKKFSNANPDSLAIAKAARSKEWARLFHFQGIRKLLLKSQSL